MIPSFPSHKFFPKNKVEPTDLVFNMTLKKKHAENFFGPKTRHKLHIIDKHKTITAFPKACMRKKGIKSCSWTFLFYSDNVQCVNLWSYTWIVRAFV